MRLFGDNPGIARRETTSLSNETLFRLMSTDEALSRRVLDMAGTVKVVLYTRDMLEMLNSSWGQKVKRAGLTTALEVWIAENHIPTYRRVRWWIEAVRRYGPSQKLFPMPRQSAG